LVPSQKQKKQPLLKFFIHLGPSEHSNGHQNIPLSIPNLQILGREKGGGMKQWAKSIKNMENVFEKN
jgi:hypothetical protein